MHSSRITDIFIWVYFFYVQPYLVEGLGFFFVFFLMSPLSAFEDINKTSIIHRSTSSTCCEWIVTLGGLNNMWNNQSLRYSCLGGSLFPPQKQKFQGIILRFRVIFSENLKSKLWFNNLKVWLTDVEKYIFFCLVWFSVAETSFHVFVSVLAILAKDNKVIRRTHRTLF